MPIPSQRVRKVLTLSSKMKSAAHSPRLAAAIANWTATLDLPVPGAPTKSVLVPFSMPPPSSSSSAARPLGMRVWVSGDWCSAATSRGNTCRPPRTIL
jgi:hypothetical protein